MPVDATQFPLVYLTAPQPDSSPGEAEAAFEALLDRGERFVVVTERPPGEEHEHERELAHETPHEARKQRALFFKRNKARMKVLCAGMVVIAGERPISLAARVAAQTLGKFLGFRCAFVRDAHEAQAQAERFLR